MPSAEEIVKSLRFITNNYTLVSIAWHLLIYFLIILLFVSNRKPSIRSTALFLSMPVFSVALISALAGNPFNAIIFFIIGLLFIIFSLRMPSQALRFNSSWFLKLIGIIFILAGTFYPHFSDDTSPLSLSAPTGLIPCPTLLLIIGFTLLVQRFSRPWVGTLVISALLYGLVGVVRLKVFIDVLLLLGVILLILEFILYPTSSKSVSNDPVEVLKISAIKKLLFVISILALLCLDAYLIYPWLCGQTATRQEITKKLTGDELVRNNNSGYTLASSIDAQPSAVWPWLIQMGQGRAGFYTHEWVEEIVGASIKNADSVIEAFQYLSEGDSIRLTPDPYLGKRAQYLSIAKLDSPFAIVYKQTLPNGSAGSWAFILEPDPNGKTRLVFRRRSEKPSLFDKIATPGYYFMDIGMLAGIKERAEKRNN
jgi:hypothetical protein